MRKLLWGNTSWAPVSPGSSSSRLCVDAEAESWLGENLLYRAVNADVLVLHHAVGQLGTQAGLWRDQGVTEVSQGEGEGDSPNMISLWRDFSSLKKVATLQVYWPDRWTAGRCTLTVWTSLPPSWPGEREELLQTSRRVLSSLRPTVTGARPELGTHCRNGDSADPKYHWARED